MRATMFLSTLFAMSLVGSAALAERPSAQSTPGAREPRAIEQIRAHGDVIDKVYVAADHGRPQQADAQPTRDAGTARPAAKLQVRDSRINCGADTDCGAASKSGATPARSTEQQPSTAPAQRSAAKSPVDTKKDERANCGADVDCGSPSGRAWSGGGSASGGGSSAQVNFSFSATMKGGGESGKGGVQVSQHTMNDTRLKSQPSEARMSCNEADECSMSSKEATKMWAYKAVRAGTFTGPHSVSDKTAEARATAEKARLNSEIADKAAHADKDKDAAKDKSATSEAVH